MPLWMLTVNPCHLCRKPNVINKTNQTVILNPSTVKVNMWVLYDQCKKTIHGPLVENKSLISRIHTLSLFTVVPFNYMAYSTRGHIE